MNYQNHLGGFFKAPVHSIPFSPQQSIYPWMRVCVCVCVCECECERDIVFFNRTTIESNIILLVTKNKHFEIRFIIYTSIRQTMYIIITHSGASYQF